MAKEDQNDKEAESDRSPETWRAMEIQAIHNT
jgi:hypothetical protein